MPTRNLLPYHFMMTRVLAGLALAVCLLSLACPVLAASAKGPLSQAKEAFDAGRPTEAAAVLAEAVKREPADDRLWALLGRARAATGDRAKAVEAYRMAVKINPADTLTRMRLDMLADLAGAPADPPEKSGKPSQSGQSGQSGRSGTAVKSTRPPSALERAALDELAKAKADPEHLGCAAKAQAAMLDPLPAAGLSDDLSLELARRVAEAAGVTGVAVPVLTRHGAYQVRLAERAALAELSGAPYYFALATVVGEGKTARVELLVSGPAPSDARQAEAASRLALLAKQAEPGLAGQPGQATASALEAVDAALRRAESGREAARLAEAVAARCREAGLEAGAPATGQAALFAAVDRPAVLVALTLPADRKAAEAAVGKLAGALARVVADRSAPCP